MVENSSFIGTGIDGIGLLCQLILEVMILKMQTVQISINDETFIKIIINIAPDKRVTELCGDVPLTSSTNSLKSHSLYRTKHWHQSLINGRHVDISRHIFG